MVYGSLCLQGPEKAAKKFPINQQFTYVGKDRDCDVRFAVAKFDGKQFLLTASQDARVKIQNLSKRYPTLVNEREIGFQVDRDIKENDVISAGCWKLKWSYQYSPGKNAKSQSLKRRASEPALRRVAVVNPCRREPVQEVEDPPPKRRRTAYHPTNPPTPHHCRSGAFIPTPSALARRVQYDKTLRASKVSPMTKNQVHTLRGSTQGATPKRVSFFHPPGTPNYQFNPPDLNNRSITPRTFYSRGLKSSTPYAFKGFNNIAQDTPPSLLRDYSSFMTTGDSTPREKSGRVSTPFPDRKRNVSIRKSRNSKNRQSSVTYFETIEENENSPAHVQGSPNRRFLSDLNEFSRDQTPASYFSPPPNGSPRMMRAESPQLSQKLLFNERQSLMSNNSQYGTPPKSLAHSSQFSSLYVNPSSSQQGTSYSGNGYSHNFTWNSGSPRSGWDTFSTTPPQLRTPKRSIIDETQGSASFSPMSCTSGIDLGPRNLSVNLDFRHGQPNLNSSRAPFSFSTPPRRQFFDKAVNQSLSVQVLSRAVRNKLSRGVNPPSPLTPGLRRQNLTNNKKTSRSQSPSTAKVDEIMVEQAEDIEKTPPKRKSSVKMEKKSSARKSQTPSATSRLSSAGNSTKKTSSPQRKSVESSSDDRAASRIETRTSLKNSKVQTRSSDGKPSLAVKRSLKGRPSDTVSPVKKPKISKGSPSQTKTPVASPRLLDVAPAVSLQEDVQPASESAYPSRKLLGPVKPRGSVSSDAGKGERSSTRVATPATLEGVQSGRRNADSLSSSLNTHLGQSGAKSRRTRSSKGDVSHTIASDVGRQSKTASTPRNRNTQESVSSPLNLSALFLTPDPARSEDSVVLQSSRASSRQSSSQPRSTRSSKNDISVVAVKTGIRKFKSASTSMNISNPSNQSTQFIETCEVVQPEGRNSVPQSSRRTSGLRTTSTPNINQNVSVSSPFNLSTLFQSRAGDDGAVPRSTRGSWNVSVQQSGSRSTRSSKDVTPVMVEADVGKKSKSLSTAKNRGNNSIMSPLTELFQTPEPFLSTEPIVALQSSGKVCVSLEQSGAESRRTRSSKTNVSVVAVKTGVRKSTSSSKSKAGRRSISSPPSPLTTLFQTPQAAHGDNKPEVAANVNLSANTSAQRPISGRQSRSEKRTSTSNVEHPISPLTALFQTPEVLSRSPHKSTSQSASVSDTSISPSNAGCTSGNRIPTIRMSPATPRVSTTGASPQPSTPPNTTPPQIVLLSSRKSSVRKVLQSSPPTPTRTFRRNPSRSAKKQWTSGKVIRQRINSSRSPKPSSVVKKLKLDPEKPDKKKMAVLKICHLRKSPINKEVKPFLPDLGNVRRSLDYGPSTSKSQPEISLLNHSLPNSFRFGDFRKIQSASTDVAEEVIANPIASELDQDSPKYELLNALSLSQAGSLIAQKPSRRLRSNAQNQLKPPAVLTTPKKLQFKTPLVEFEGSSYHEPNSGLTPLKSIVASSIDAMNRMYTSSPAVSYTDSSGRKKTFRISPSSPSKGGSIKELVPEDELALPVANAQASAFSSSPRKLKLPSGKQDDESRSTKRAKGASSTPDDHSNNSSKSPAVRQTRAARKVAKQPPKKKTVAKQQLIDTPSTAVQGGKVVKATRRTRQNIVDSESPTLQKSPKKLRTNGQTAESGSPKLKKGKEPSKRLAKRSKKEVAVAGEKKSPSPRKTRRGGKAAADVKSPSPRKTRRGGEAMAIDKSPSPKSRQEPKVAFPPPKKPSRGKAKASASPPEMVASPKKTRRGVLKATYKVISPLAKKVLRGNAKTKASAKGKSPASNNNKVTPSPKKRGQTKTIAASKGKGPSPGTSRGGSKAVATKALSPKKKSPSPKKALLGKPKSSAPAKKAGPKAVSKDVSVSPKKLRSKIAKTLPEPKGSKKKKSPSPRKLQRSGKNVTNAAKPHMKSPAKNTKTVSKPAKSKTASTKKNSLKELRVGKVVRSLKSKK